MRAKYSRVAPSRSSAAARASPLSGMRIPVSPSVMPSAAQLPSMSTLPSEHAAASRTTRPFVSNVEGKSRRSARVYHTRIASRSRSAPVKRQRPVRPSCAAYSSTAARSWPSPTNTMQKSPPASRTFLSPSRRMRSPLYHIMRPINRYTGLSGGSDHLLLSASTASGEALPRGRSTPFGMTI